MSEFEVVIIGAGPYGLSAAAHLKSKGIAVRVFGKAMDFWATKMPAGMLLRSPRVASNISDPSHGFALPAYEAANGIPSLAPLPLSTFVDYGQWFQRKLIADLDTREVVSVDRFNGGFRTVLADGTSVTSDRVVVAAGIGPFQRIPPVFQDLSSEQVSHCYSGTDVKAFSGKRVVVIGAGQSALESAALLHEAGAEVEIVMRQGELRWIGGHPWLHKLGPISSLMYSQHDVGPAGISRMVAMPNLMRRMPLDMRDKIRKRAVRPAGSQWLRPRLATVKTRIGRHVTAAASAGSQVQLTFDDGSSYFADHVLLGTGYTVDISRFSFLPAQLLNHVCLFEGYPVLESGFCSSLPGLHFIGATAARTFGPLLYFVAGTEFASRALASNIAQNRTAK
jgi:FAD-dependent urate hydroxylase